MAAKPTLVSLARELGVSRQTISNALNAPHRVNARTLERVLPAIEESGYRPHVAGRQLRTRRSRNLAMRLFPSADGINGAILDRFLHALTEAAQRDGYRLTLFTAPDDEGEIAAIDELLSVADIDGFVLTSTHHDDARTAWLLEHDVPFVAFGRPWSSDGPVRGAAPVGGRGRRIRYVGRDRPPARTRPPPHRVPRLAGRIRRRRRPPRRVAPRPRRGAGVDPATGELSLGVEDSVAEGARGARELFARGATALVCASDSLAIGAVAAWREGAPDASAEVPVIGFDDTPVAAALGLSSVRQPIEQVAERVLALLLQRLAGGTDATAAAAAAPEHVLLPASLVLRAPDPHLVGARSPGSGHPRP